LPEARELVVPLGDDAGVEVAAGDAIGGGGERRQRPRDRAREENGRGEGREQEQRRPDRRCVAY